MPKIAVKAVTRKFGKEDKFDHFSITIGESTTDSPIKYLRVSEMHKLEELLIKVYELGVAHGNSN